MIDEFPVNIEKSLAVKSPENKNIFKVDGSKTLKNDKAELYHTTLARGILLYKISRPEFRPIFWFYALE